MPLKIIRWRKPILGILQALGFMLKLLKAGIHEEDASFEAETF